MSTIKYFIKHVLGYCVTLGMAIVWLITFIQMAKSPTSYIAIGEPNKLIWTIEVIMFISVIAWSVKEIITRANKG